MHVVCTVQAVPHRAVVTHRQFLPVRLLVHLATTTGIIPKNCCRRESKRPREKGAPMTPRAHDRHFAAQKCSQDLTINHDYREFLRH